MKKKKEVGYGFSGKRTKIEKAMLATALAAMAHSAFRMTHSGTLSQSPLALPANLLLLTSIVHGAGKRVKEKKRSIPGAIVRSYGRNMGQTAKTIGWAIPTALGAGVLGSLLRKRLGKI